MASSARNGDTSGPIHANDDDAGSRALYGGTVPPLIAGPIAETSAEDLPPGPAIQAFIGRSGEDVESNILRP